MGLAMTPPTVLGGELKEVMPQSLAKVMAIVIFIMSASCLARRRHSGVIKVVVLWIQPHSTAEDEPAYSTVCPLWSLNRR